MSGERGRMQVIAHRGASAHEPENTLRAIRRAIEIGADGVEIDVQLVGDTLVVIHDETLERTTSGHGPVAAHSLAALRALDAGHGERIPLLTEVIDLIDARLDLNIELKGPGTAEPVIALVRESLVRRPAWRNRFLLSSFDADRTARAALQRDGWRLGILFEGPAEAALARARMLGADSLHVALGTLTAALVGEAHRAGIAVFVYTVNDAAALGRCLELGVDAVFSDEPERAISVRATRDGA